MDEKPDTQHNSYSPSLWEKITAYVFAGLIIITVLILVIRNEPIADPNAVIILRILISLGVSIIGAVIPGFLNIDFSGKGIFIRSGGALALFIATYVFTPKVILKPPVIIEKPVSSIKDIIKKSNDTMVKYLTMESGPKRLIEQVHDEAISHIKSLENIEELEHESEKLDQARHVSTAYLMASESTLDNIKSYDYAKLSYEWSIKCLNIISSIRKNNPKLSNVLESYNYEDKIIHSQITALIIKIF